MDATGRLTYRLLNRDTQAERRKTSPFTEINRGWLCFQSPYLLHPSVVPYHAEKFSLQFKYLTYLLSEQYLV